MLLFTEDFIKENPDWIEDKIKNILKIPITASSFSRQLGAIMNFSTYDRLHTINTPTLLMHGKKDILVPTKNSEILAEKITGAKLVYFDNSAHFLFSHEPKLITEALVEFLS